MVIDEAPTFLDENDPGDLDFDLESIRELRRPAHLTMAEFTRQTFDETDGSLGRRR